MNDTEHRTEDIEDETDRERDPNDDGEEEDDDDVTEERHRDFD